MADIAAFNAHLYDPARVPDLAPVLAPPYDVISTARRAELFARSPYNITHVDIQVDPTAPPADPTALAAGYARGGEILARWMAEGVLTRDAAPAVYPMEQSFEVPGRGVRVTRRGVFCAVRLAAPGGAVKAHERTHAGPKVDRFNLMRATGAQLSSVFALCPDPTGAVRELLAQACAQPAVRDCADPDSGGRLAAWRLTDPAAHARLAEAVAAQALVIADGHHRYETALRYRDEVGPTLPAGAPPAGERALDWVLMFLVPMEDAGLVVLPYHRLLKLSPRPTLDALAARLAPSFDVARVPAAEAAARAHAERPAGPTRFAFVLRGEREGLVATLRPGAFDAHPRAAGVAPELRALDVEILQRLVVEEALGLDPHHLKIDVDIAYTFRADEATARVADEGWDLALLVNPTPVSQVRAVAESGLTMPQKSTYFFPKLPTGLVLRTLGAAERIVPPPRGAGAAARQ